MEFSYVIISIVEATGYEVCFEYKQLNAGFWYKGPQHWIIIIIIIIILFFFFFIIIEFLTSQLWLGNIHLSLDVVINRIRLGGLICSLKSFLQLNMCQELQIFAVVYMYWGAS